MDAQVSDAPQAADFARGSRLPGAYRGCARARPGAARSGTQRLRDAMRYSVLGAGKRLRPTLVYLTGESLGAPLRDSTRPRPPLN